MDKSKILIAAIGIVIFGMVAALVIINLGPSKDTTQEAMFEKLEFNGKAREACIEAIKNNSKYELAGLMFDSEGDGRNSAIFTWKGDGKKGDKNNWALKDSTFEKLACKFEKGKGVVSLAADDQVVFNGPR